VAALPIATALIAGAPARADPPQCDAGPLVQYNCPDGPADAFCTAVIDGQCVGVAAPLLPPPGPVRVGIEGGIGAEG
jgi:hypothetical protein